MTTLEREPADVVSRNLAIGARLSAGATTFAFFCPFFAYLYLRSLNSASLWRPAHVDPPQGLGATITALIAVSAIAMMLAARPASASAWMPLVALALASGLASVALQCVAYAHLGFDPTDGGYASVFVAWTGLNAVFVFGTMLWAETLLAYGLRTRRQTSPPVGEFDSPHALIQPRLAALAFYWTYLAVLGVVMWAILYLV
jgi:heme/copper-type cytochrome/quinol oxidase subunit 3